MLGITIAYCKNSCDGVWYTYDDQRVSVTSLWPTEKGTQSGRYEQHLCTEHAYILFYQRRSMSMSAWAKRARQETKMRFKRQLDWLSALSAFCTAPEQPIASAEYPLATPPARTLTAHPVLVFLRHSYSAHNAYSIEVSHVLYLLHYCLFAQYMRCTHKLCAVKKVNANTKSAVCTVHCTVDGYLLVHGSCGCADAQSRVARLTAHFKSHLLNDLLTPALLNASQTKAALSHSLWAIDDEKQRSRAGEQHSPEGAQKPHWLLQTPSFSPQHTPRAAVFVSIPRQSARYNFQIPSTSNRTLYLRNMDKTPLLVYELKLPSLLQ